MFGINNIKDFLETVTYIVAIVLGIQEIINSRKGKQFPSCRYYYIQHFINMQVGGIITLLIIFYIVIKRRNKR